MSQDKDTSNKRETGSDDVIRDVTGSEYKYGFVSDIDSDIIERGLNEDVVRLISKKKGEHDWLLDFRLKAFRYWETLKMPTW
ncbi:MAG: Fe-S cluster assembly protein SufB, partial [Muribaculaceae bacterium]|nr:Fe-S cluster assembly protein SufB [Muribaculaceae bacterium]